MRLTHVVFAERASSGSSDISITFMTALRVGFLCALFLIVGYSSQIFIVWPWYGRAPPPNLAKLLLPFK